MVNQLQNNQKIHREIEEYLTEGRKVNLVGKSGAGKTTLLRKILDLNI
ncbi:ATP-binding cassette domain-containing protein [Crinalium epipsammum]|nr:ATP-binding cassette domain-containing protein [Crinalium epipsammum]